MPQRNQVGGSAYMNTYAGDAQLIPEHIDVLVGLKKNFDSLSRSQQRGVRPLNLFFNVVN